MFKSLEYLVAYENLQPSTDAYKRVAYKKNESSRVKRGHFDPKVFFIFVAKLLIKKTLRFRQIVYS